MLNAHLIDEQLEPRTGSQWPVHGGAWTEIPGGLAPFPASALSFQSVTGRVTLLPAPCLAHPLPHLP